MSSAELPLVLIPGFMLDETLWQRFIDRYPQERRFIRPALSGGDSIPEIAAAICQDLPPRFILVGFSLGGYVARSIVEQFPQRVAGLILIATSLREDTPQQAEVKRAAAESALCTEFHGLSSLAIKRSVHADRADDRALIGQIQQMGRRLGKAAFAVQSSLVRRNITTRPITCPVLAIAARDDRLRTLEEARELAAAIPDAQLEIVGGCGHMLPLEKPEALGQIIAGWLAERVTA